MGLQQLLNRISERIRPAPVLRNPREFCLAAALRRPRGGFKNLSTDDIASKKTDLVAKYPENHSQDTYNRVMQRYPFVGWYRAGCPA
jgi:hypothetical protein